MNPQRTAIVTGAARRVGRRLAEALLADGWLVVAHVHDQADGVPEGAVRVVADLAQADCAARIFAAASAPVSLLVNNAARFGGDSLDSPDADEFAAHMAVNARAPLLLISEMARRHELLREVGGGEALIVNMLDAKLVAPNPDFLSYTMSKYALAGLTEVAARALAGQGIRVNAIAPALMLPSGEQSAENFEAMHAANPLNIGVEVDDVVAALRYLVGARTVTGQTLILDGGQRFMALTRDVQFLEQ